jgi:hypothetical protein
LKWSHKTWHRGLFLPVSIWNRIPTTLGLLTNLRTLNLEGNALYGQVGTTTFASLVHLRVLNLSFNQLGGTLEEMFLVPTTNTTTTTPQSFSPPFLLLEELVLEHNLFGGTIPEQLGDLTNLHLLRLGTNHLNNGNGAFTTTYRIPTKLVLFGTWR